jgi:hypothetical protein
MELVKLSRIVKRWSPELYPFLKPDELETCIVLRDGVERLNREDALEIIENSICKHQKDAILH